jgi:hypothetical protein
MVPRVALLEGLASQPAPPHPPVAARACKTLAKRPGRTRNSAMACLRSAGNGVTRTGRSDGSLGRGRSYGGPFWTGSGCIRSGWSLILMCSGPRRPERKPVGGSAWTRVAPQLRYIAGTSWPAEAVNLVTLRLVDPGWPHLARHQRRSWLTSRGAGSLVYEFLGFGLCRIGAGVSP